jgi:hypothetical protein
VEYLEFEEALRTRFIADMEGTTRLEHRARVAQARASVSRNDPRYHDALRRAARGIPWAF